MIETKEAMERCKETGNEEWREKHGGRLQELTDKLPYGSGIDCGTKIEELTSKKCVFTFGFHHMDESGYYDGWTQHKLTVTPTLTGNIHKITGPNKNAIKAYLHDLYWEVLEGEEEQE